MKVLELFGGIGACTSALKRLDIDFEVVDYVEIDKFAVKSYNAINDTNYEPQDVREWDKDIEVDLIMHGSPCQDFSIAGANQGGDKGSGTRSSLMYETLRIVEKLQPKYVIWENVKNVLSDVHIHNFINYLDYSDYLGYHNNYKVLNAKDYGVPQNRERVFTVSLQDYQIFEFPSPEVLTKKLKDILEIDVDEKYYLSDKLLANFTDMTNRNGFVRGERFRPLNEYDEYGYAVTTSSGNRVTDNYIIQLGRGFNSGGKHEISPTLTSNSWEHNNFVVASTQKNAAISYDGISPTLTSAMGMGGGQIPMHNYNSKIRKLTPLECWRLMGFTDEEFRRAEKVNSNTQLYKQAGNSIVVDVLEKILYNLLIEDYKQHDIQLNIMDL